jgi:hypothetical protein
VAAITAIRVAISMTVRANGPLPSPNESILSPNGPISWPNGLVW